MKILVNGRHHPDALVLGIQGQTIRGMHDKAVFWAPSGAKSYDLEMGTDEAKATYYTGRKEGKHPCGRRPQKGEA